MSLALLRTSCRLILAGAIACTLAMPAEAKGKKVQKKVAAAAAQKSAVPPGPPVPPRNARPVMVIDWRTGKVIEAVNPFTPWHPASLTKMMTTYVALQAVKAHRLSKDTLLTVTPYAASQKPAKMGFAPGTKITLESALYFLFVKSANDVAVTVAEGVSGSVPAFADEMNAWSRRLGMAGSVWRNPNGWHDDGQYTTARDLAVLARALYRDFPEYQHIFNTQALQYGEWTMRNFNVLIGRFPGADGLKTGFTCPSGFNLVGSAVRNGERHIAVVLGENSGKARGEKAAYLLNRSFALNASADNDNRPTIETLQRPGNTLGAPPNLKQEVCGGKQAPSEADEAAPSGQVLSFVQGAPISATAAALASAGGETQPLISPPPPQVKAVVLARTVVDPKDKRPLTVAVAGTSVVGAGLTPPPIAVQPADIRITDANTAIVPHEGIAAVQETARPPGSDGQQTANLAPLPLAIPSAPVALVPASVSKPAPAPHKKAAEKQKASAKSKPAEKAKPADKSKPTANTEPADKTKAKAKAASNS